MFHAIWTFLYCAIMLFTHIKASIECNCHSDCCCLPIQDYKLITCNREQVTIKLKEEYYYTMKCLDSEPFHLTILPKIKFNSSIHYFTIRKCALNFRLKALLEKFNMSRVVVLSLESISRKYLKKEFFFEVENINQLKLVENDEEANIPDQLFDNFKNLQILVINNYNIPVIQKGIFTSLQRLKYLVLTFNKITDINEGALDNLTKLKEIFLQFNKLRTLPPDLFKYNVNLKRIKLSGNFFLKLPDTIFASLYQLRKLEIDNLNLTTISERLFYNNSKIDGIDLRYNQLTALPPKLFSFLKDLHALHLDFNLLKELPEQSLQELVNLKEISLTSNSFKELPEKLFASSQQLEIIHLSENKVETIPGNLYKKTKNLKEIYMLDFGLKELPSRIFISLENLQVLDLGYNSLTQIPSDLFRYSINLTDLNLEYNYLKELPNNIFASTKRLKMINLRNNNLVSLPNFIFEQLDDLKNVYLQNNKLVSTYGWTFLSSSQNLMIMNLSSNRICDARFKIFVENLDLSYNNIQNLSWRAYNYVTNLDLSYNKITSINITTLTVSPYPTSKNNYTLINLLNNEITEVIFDLDNFKSQNHITTIFLGNNPLKCNCKLRNLTRHFRNEFPDVKEFVDIQPENLKCFHLEKAKYYIIESLEADFMVCPFEEMFLYYPHCPDDCACGLRKADRTFVIDCSYRNLTKIPQIVLPLLDSFNQTELILQGNYLEGGPERDLAGVDNVTILDLSKNRIANITWLPPRINKLYLHQNNLDRMNDHVQATLSKAKTFTLGDNPWICDCPASGFVDFLQKHVNQTSDAGNIKCKNTDTTLINLHKATLCNEPQIWIYISIPSLIVCTFFSIVVAFYYRYNRLIKIWLYSKQMCLWWVNEEDLDRDKTYDAFVTYANDDEDFITSYLIPVLEEEKNYKLCLHTRDWIGGDFITDQINRSVQNSRRTIVILSSNFLQSYWGRLEFQTAYTQAMTERIPRIIVIIYGDVNEEDLDGTIKSYFKSNTYIKWGDPWFWRKLLYAMPHSKYITPNDDEILMSGYS